MAVQGSWMMMAVTLGQVNNPVPATPATTPNPEGFVATVFDMAIKGGFVMIPIALCSLVALAIIIERLVTLRRSRVIPDGLIEGVRGALASGGVPSALERARASNSAMGRVFEAGLKRWDKPIEQVERYVRETGMREAGMLRKHLRGLVAIALVGPQLGLLGTVIGMIRAFRTVASSPEALGRTEMLAKGIYEGMVATAAGLILAVPVVISFHYLSGRIERLVLEMDGACLELVELAQTRGTATSAATSGSSRVPVLAAVPTGPVTHAVEGAVANGVPMAVGAA